MDNDKARLNEAQAMLDVMSERLGFVTRFLKRLLEDVEGQLSLNEDLVDEYDRLVNTWADQDEDTRPM